MRKPLVSPWPYPRWIAHRGAGQLAPENTLAAFRLGFQHGYRMFECDAKLSADGVPFLLHDDTLNRTTNGCGPSSAHPWHHLQTLDAGSWHPNPVFHGEKLPTLVDVIHFCRDHACALNIEIKPNPGEDAATGAAVALAVLRLWDTAATPPLLSSFSTTALQAARQVAPTLPLGWLLHQWCDDWVESAQALACQALIGHHSVWSRERVQQAQALGLWTASYTVNDAAQAQRLLDWGLDAIITDAIDQLPEQL